MTYVPITYIPDGAVTARLKRNVKGRRPKPKLGNLGPLLDENFAAAKKDGHLLFHPDDLRLLPGVADNPDIVDDGVLALQQVMADKGIEMPTVYQRAVPYYPDVPAIIKRTVALAAAMTIAITIAVLLGQDDAIAAMTVAIVAISLGGAALFYVIVSRSIIHIPTTANPIP